MYEAYKRLKNFGKEIDNHSLSKIFEWYTCIKLTEKQKDQFYHYDDIEPHFKEENMMTINDTGIDVCNKKNTIVQCKLRSKYLTFKECATFLASQNIHDCTIHKTIIHWEKLVIARNEDCKLSKNLLYKRGLFIDETFCIKKMIDYCEDMLLNPPQYKNLKMDFKLRDYQLECIDLINREEKNTVICIPTGTGKNSVIIYSFIEGEKYLILVPHIILMEQFENNLLEHKPYLKESIQLIGDHNNNFDINKLITICVFNSVHMVEQYAKQFKKIYIDEAHKIYNPSIYTLDFDEDFKNLDKDNDRKYKKIIKELSQHDNNVYLSATIDNIDGWNFYKKDIREMIEIGYLCDYDIHLPIFNKDPDHMKICKYLLDKYEHIILYCESRKEGKHINDIFNQIYPGISGYIDCNTSRTKRQIIFEKYKKGQMLFIVNVRILIEGFDSPITRGVCLIHMPNKSSTIIQIIGRAIRPHELKKIANVILPCSIPEDEISISNFLKILARNDSRIRKSYNNKIIGGYINIKTVEDINDDLSEQAEFMYDMIYDKLGHLKNREDIWMNKYNFLCDYVQKNGDLPLLSKYDEFLRSMRKWAYEQFKSFDSKTGIMELPHIYNIWKIFMEKYPNCYKNNIEKWLIKCNKFIKYLDEHNCPPSRSGSESLKNWMEKNNLNFKQKQYLMKDENIRNIWSDIKLKYCHLFVSLLDKWDKNFDFAINYLKNNNKRPTEKSTNEEIKKCAKWLSDQHSRRNNNQFNEHRKNRWDNELMLNFSHLFLNEEEKWIEKFNKYKYFIENNNRIPSLSVENEKSLYNFMNRNTINYGQKKGLVYINNNIRSVYEKFINEHISFFPKKEKRNRSYDTKAWNEKFEKLRCFVELHEKFPLRSDDSNLQEWVYRQNRNYISYQASMKEENIDIRNKWLQFNKQYEDCSSLIKRLNNISTMKDK